MITVQEQTHQVQQWLTRQHKLKVPEDWLEACIEWVHSEHQGVSVGMNQLRDMVYEQWLISDLREIGAACLPPGVSHLEKTYLNGAFHLQLLSATDVSCSLYSQLRKVQGKHNDNEQVSAAPPSQFQEPKGNRMLKLHLTDGAQEIHGIEYKPLSQLNLTPGCKLVVYGKVLCRQGVLFLTRECVRGLGGEVDSLVEETTADIVLSSALERNVALGENPPSPRIRKRDPSSTANIKRSQKNTHSAKAIKRPVTASVADSFPPRTTTHYPGNNTAQQWNDDFDDDDILLSQIDIPQPKTEATTQPRLSNHQSSLPNHKSSTARSVHNVNPGKMQSRQTNNAMNNMQLDEDWPDFDENDFDQNFDSLGQSMNARVSSETKTRSEEPSVKRRQISLSPPRVSTASSYRANLSQNKPVNNIAESAASHSHLFNTVTVKEEMTSQRTSSVQTASTSQQKAVCHIAPIIRGQIKCEVNDSSESTGGDVKEQLMRQPSKSLEDKIKSGSASLQHCHIDTRTPPFSYLCLISWPPIERTSVVVKGYISTLNSKLEHNNGQGWSLSVKINDSSAAMDVDVSDLMLTKLIGFTSQECMRLKPLAKTDGEVRLKITQGIKQCQEKIISMSALLELDLLPGFQRPLLTGFHPVTRSILEALKRRVMSVAS